MHCPKWDSETGVLRREPAQWCMEGESWTVEHRHALTCWQDSPPSRLIKWYKSQPGRKGSFSWLRGHFSHSSHSSEPPLSQCNDPLSHSYVPVSLAWLRLQTDAVQHSPVSHYPESCLRDWSKLTVSFLSETLRWLPVCRMDTTIRWQVCRDLALLVNLVPSLLTGLSRPSPQSH